MSESKDISIKTDSVENVTVAHANVGKWAYSQYLVIESPKALKQVHVKHISVINTGL